jgi:hypothetical protein
MFQFSFWFLSCWYWLKSLRLAFFSTDSKYPKCEKRRNGLSRSQLQYVMMSIKRSLINELNFLDGYIIQTTNITKNVWKKGELIIKKQTTICYGDKSKSSLIDNNLAILPIILLPTYYALYVMKLLTLIIFKMRFNNLQYLLDSFLSRRKCL